MLVLPVFMGWIQRLSPRGPRDLQEDVGAEEVRGGQRRVQRGGRGLWGHGETQNRGSTEGGWSVVCIDAPNSHWLMRIEGCETDPFKNRLVNDDADGRPYTGPEIFLPKGHQIGCLGGMLQLKWWNQPGDSYGIMMDFTVHKWDDLVVISLVFWAASIFGRYSYDQLGFLK